MHKTLGDLIINMRFGGGCIVCVCFFLVWDVFYFVSSYGIEKKTEARRAPSRKKTRTKRGERRCNERRKNDVPSFDFFLVVFCFFHGRWRVRVHRVMTMLMMMIAVRYEGLPANPMSSFIFFCILSLSLSAFLFFSLR